jgi:hypothetical protein
MLGWPQVSWRDSRNEIVDAFFPRRCGNDVASTGLLVVKEHVMSCVAGGHPAAGGLSRARRNLPKKQ